MNIQSLPDVQLHFSHLKEQEILQRIEMVRELRAGEAMAAESKSAEPEPQARTPRVVPILILAAFALIAALSLFPHPV